jgi:hypothetical protein
MFEDIEEYEQEPIEGLPSSKPQLPIMANYEVDQLNYLRDITVDDYYSRVLNFIDYTKFTEKTKDDLRLLVFTYTEPVDFILTNIRSDEELRRFYNVYRLARKKLKCGIPQRDNTTTLSLLLDHLESHLQLRLSRSKNGFERMEQSSVRQHQFMDSNLKQTQQGIEQRKDSISQIFNRG